MSNERNQISRRTAGNANLLSILGDLISSDGIQALRVPLGTPGQFFGVDLTQECGVGWLTPGGGGSLTFSDGVTRTIDNVTNDLVIGTPVAKLEAVVALANVNAIIDIDPDGTINIRAGNDGGGDQPLNLLGGVVELAGSGSANVTGGAGNASLTNLTNARFRITSAGGLDLLTTIPGQGFELNVTGAGGDMQVEVNDRINLIAGDNTTGGLQFTSNGTLGIILETPGSNAVAAINLDAAGGGFLAANATGSRFVIGVNGSIQVTGAGATGAINISTSSNNLLSLASGGNAELTAAGGGASNGDIDVTALNTTGTLTLNGGTTNVRGRTGISISPDINGPAEIVTGGTGNLHLDATGTGQVTIEAGSSGGTGQVQVQPGTASATRTFAIFTGVGAGQKNGAILPAGGAVVDAEMRAAFDTFVNYFFNWGWVTNPTP